MDTLTKHGFEVEYPFHGMHTAFKGVIKGSKPGPTIVILRARELLAEIKAEFNEKLLK